MPTQAELEMIDHYISDASDRGVDVVTIRRLAEPTHATGPRETARLRELLSTHRMGHFQPPVYTVRSS
jgi:hypothetical protein